jgi:hypothetical protein
MLPLSKHCKQHKKAGIAAGSIVFVVVGNVFVIGFAPNPLFK